MWRIVDHTRGRILAALKEHWSGQTASDALERNHGFGAATDIGHELTYLGFEQHKDFDIDPARTAIFLGDIERLPQGAAR
jgi:hypothetical protein